MGIGFVVVVWAVILGVLAIPVAAVLLVAARRMGGQARATRVLRWPVVAAPVAAGYAGAGFLAYAFWCSEVRGVDPGIGDSWRVPLGQGFSLVFIDVLDTAYILSRHTTDGGTLVSGITQIGQSGIYVYGLAGTDSAFILDTRSGAVHLSLRQALPAALRAAGAVGSSFEPVDDFYLSRRWGWPDLVAAAVLAGPVLLFGGRSGRRAWGRVDAQVA